MNYVEIERVGPFRYFNMFYLILSLCSADGSTWIWRLWVGFSAGIVQRLSKVVASHGCSVGGVSDLSSMQYTFVEIDHEIFSTVILPLPLIQEGQLSVPGKRMHKHWLTA